MPYAPPCPPLPRHPPRPAACACAQVVHEPFDPTAPRIMAGAAASLCPHSLSLGPGWDECVQPRVVVQAGTDVQVTRPGGRVEGTRQGEVDTGGGGGEDLTCWQAWVGTGVWR